jgi:hypothetical protein
MFLEIHNLPFSIVERISWALHVCKMSSRRIYLRFGPSRCSISQTCMHVMDCHYRIAFLCSESGYRFGDCSIVS